MLRKPDMKESDLAALQKFYEQSVADMLADPDLTEAQKQELLRQLELADEEWEPTELPEGVEPLSETIIKMRRGN
ncbi:MAG TPA: hypothetical protein VJZ26_00700 [Blastocatellia bacterium]|nr:hypothetical protein [Blastocatellia bacterium]